MRRPALLKRLLERGRRGERGVSAVEFALLSPVLAALFLGLVDLGLVWGAQMQVNDAAQAGAEYAALNGFVATDIEAAETNAVSAAVVATPAPTEVCGCPTTTGVSVIDCSDACPGGGRPGSYVEVGASLSHSLLLPYPGLTNPMTLTASAMVRVQ